MFATRHLQLAYVPAGVSLLAYHDDFNRADNVDAGVDWTPQGANSWKIITNTAVPASTFAGLSVEKNSNLFLTNNHRVKILHGTLTNAFYLPFVRAASGNSIGAFIQSGQTWTIRSYTAYTGITSNAIGTQRAVTPAAVTVASADTLSLEAVNEYYIVRKKVVVQVIWHDPGAATHNFVDASHRDVVAGMYMNGITPVTGGMNDFWADDIVPAFKATRMTKSGTQAWQTAASWVTITTWTAVNDATYDTVITSNALNVIVGKTGATIAASIPYTGATVGTTHQVRIVRIRNSAGGAVTEVVATGSNVTTATGTATVSTTVDVFTGEQYRVEMLGSAASAGTITATTPTLTIS